MNLLRKTTFLRVVLVVVLTVTFRFGAVGLNNIDCRSDFSQILFVCDMGFFVLPILILATVLAAVIPYIKLTDKRDRIAGFATLLLIPAVVNALWVSLDFAFLNCGGDGYYIYESRCVETFAQIIFLALPTLAAIIFVLVKGWRFLLVKRSY